MILVRDVFRIEFGQMKPALATIKQLSASLSESGESWKVRFLTDLSGPFYTLVLESEFEDLAAYEATMKSSTATEAWQKWYREFVPYLKDGTRELYTIVAD